MILTCKAIECFLQITLYVLQSCPTLYNLMDCSLPGSSVCGILQARMLEWVGMPSCKGIFLIPESSRVSYVSYIGRWVLYH